MNIYIVKIVLVLIIKNDNYHDYNNINMRKHSLNFEANNN